MNLFLEQKTNPSKFKIAKIFAILLVCFFVGEVNRAFAFTSVGDGGVTGGTAAIYTPPPPPGVGLTIGGTAQIPILWGATSYSSNVAVNTVYFKNPTDNSVYKVRTLYSSYDSATGLGRDAVSAETFKIDPATGTEVPTSNFTTYPTASTELPINPVGLNSTPNSPLTYDYTKGAYVYKNPTTGATETIDPANVKARVAAIQAADLAAGTPNANLSAGLTTAAQQNSMQTSTAASNAAPTGSTTKPAQPLNCGTNFMSIDIDCLSAKVIYTITIVPAGLVLAGSGWLMDAVFKYTVVNLKATLDGGFYAVIKIVWGMFRDIINMTFIFLLLYASIKTILQADTAGLKNTIKNVIIVAILINFSLFFTTTIIDVSNTIAVGMYNQINQGTSSTNNLADAFLKKLNLQTLLTDASSFPTAGGNIYNNVRIISIFGSVFILVLAVVFFVISILFIVRFVTLIILMMMSPVGIAGLAIPKLKEGFGGSYWGDLLSQCFFAPIMIFFLWISIKMLDAIVKLGVAPGSPQVKLASALTDPKTAAASLGGYILGFTVLIFMLIKGMEYGKSLSSKGAGAVQSGLLKYSGADLIQKKMQNAPRGIAGAVGRQSVGRAATRLTESKSMKEWAANNAFGRMVYKGAQKTGAAGFGGKAGFSKNEANSVKAQEKFREDISKKSKDEERKIAEQEEKVYAAKHDAELATEIASAHRANVLLNGEEITNEDGTTTKTKGFEESRNILKEEEKIALALEHVNVLEAEEALKKHSELEAELEEARKYLPFALDKKMAEGKIRGLEEQFTKSNTELGKSFKKVYGDINDENLAKKIADKNSLTEEKEGLQKRDTEGLFKGKTAEEIKSSKEITTMDESSKTKFEEAKSSAALRKIAEDAKENGKKLEEDLQKALKDIDIDVDIKDSESIVSAKTKAEEKLSQARNKDDSGYFKNAASSKDIAKVVEILHQQEKTDSKELIQINKLVNQQTKMRSESYAQNIGSRGWGNLFMPSEGSKRAARNIRRDLNKSPEQKAKDDVMKTITDFIKKNKEDDGGEKPKPAEKETEGKPKK